MLPRFLSIFEILTNPSFARSFQVLQLIYYESNPMNLKNVVGLSSCLAMEKRPLDKTQLIENEKKTGRYELVSSVFQVPSLIYHYLYPTKLTEASLIDGSDDYALGALPGRRLVYAKTREQKDKYNIKQSEKGRKSKPRRIKTSKKNIKIFETIERQHR